MAKVGLYRVLTGYVIMIREVVGLPQVCNELNMKGGDAMISTQKGSLLQGSSLQLPGNNLVSL